MAPGNGSFVTQFILMGLTDQPDLHLPLFFLFLGMYTVTVTGNLNLIILILLSSHLHTPMYFFLFNLSFIDLCYSSVFTPKMLINFTSKKNIISYMGCMTQLYFFCFFCISEIYVLTSMAYDRYVAICNPLLYNVVMSPKVCSSLMLGSYFMAFAGAMVLTECMLRLTFCEANTINHYFCDIYSLFQLSCTSPYISELELFIVVGINIIVPNLTILSLMFSSSPTSFKSAPKRADPKPLVPAVPMSLLFLSSLDQFHLCISNHRLLCLWMKEKSLLYFTPIRFLC